MLRPFSQIQIQQITPFVHDGITISRNSSFNIDFANDFQIDSSWESHTNFCTIKFPKNINLFGTQDGIFTYNPSCGLVLGATGTKQSPNVDAFGFPVTYAPLIMKGDIVTINHGEIYRNLNGIDNYAATGNVIFPFTPYINQNNKISSPYTLNLFFGYISEVRSGTPIEIKVEDNFYLLKRTPFPKSVWNKKESDGNTSLYGLMKYILKLTNSAFSDKDSRYPKLTLLDIPSSITAQFALGYLEIGDMTCAQLLDKLKQQYHLQSTFRGNVLQFGFPIYIDSTSDQNLSSNSNNFFCFRDIYNNSNQLVASANIFPLHDLDYKNKEDIVLSATVQCKVINKVPGKSTLTGAQVTKVQKLKVIIYWDIVSQTFKYQNLSQGQVTNTQTPQNVDGGERHEFWYPVDNSNPNPTIDQLVKYGTDHLKLYHYTGFRGCFTTFGFPFVQWNDNVNLLDTTYADRNGQYKVKRVVYKNGLKGISQEIHLDYKIDVPLPENTQTIYMI